MYTVLISILEYRVFISYQNGWISHIFTPIRLRPPRPNAHANWEHFVCAAPLQWIPEVMRAPFLYIPPRRRVAQMCTLHSKYMCTFATNVLKHLFALCFIRAFGRFRGGAQPPAPPKNKPQSQRNAATQRSGHSSLFDAHVCIGMNVVYTHTDGTVKNENIISLTRFAAAASDDAIIIARMRACEASEKGLKCVFAKLLLPRCWCLFCCARASGVSTFVWSFWQTLAGFAGKSVWARTCACI